MVTFYHNFVSHAAHLMRPLYETLRSKTAKAHHQLDGGQDSGIHGHQSSLGQCRHASPPFLRCTYRHHNRSLLAMP